MDAMDKAIKASQEKDAADALPFAHCEPLGFEDEDSCEYPDGIGKNVYKDEDGELVGDTTELENFFKEDNARLMNKWRDLGFVG